MIDCMSRGIENLFETGDLYSFESSIEKCGKKGEYEIKDKFDEYESNGLSENKVDRELESFTKENLQIQKTFINNIIDCRVKYGRNLRRLKDCVFDSLDNYSDKFNKKLCD